MIKLRSFAPGLWALIGGHIESHEINEPRIACVREIEEETGISKENLKNLNLRFIIMRKSGKEIRIQYVYDCTTDIDELRPTDEGTLHWIESTDVLNRELSFTTVELFRKADDYNEDRVLVGIVNEIEGKPLMNWNPIEDWDSESFI